LSITLRCPLIASASVTWILEAVQGNHFGIASRACPQQVRECWSTCCRSYHCWLSCDRPDPGRSCSETSRGNRCMTRAMCCYTDCRALWCCSARETRRVGCFRAWSHAGSAHSRTGPFSLGLFLICPSPRRSLWFSQSHRGISFSAISPVDCYFCFCSLSSCPSNFLWRLVFDIRLIRNDLKIWTILWLISRYCF